MDNVSTDGTVAAVEGVMEENDRIRLLRAEHHVGIYENHNRALAAASPEARYIKVLHADDWLMPECLERMVAVAERHPEVGVVGAWRLFGEERDLDALPVGREVFPGREVVRQGLLGGPYVTGSPSSLLLRASVVGTRTPFYDESLWHSDTEAIYAVLLRSDLGYCHEVLTSTRLHLAANTPFSDDIKTYAPENILMLIRHGRAVLSEREYRRQLMSEVASYGWFLSKQLLKPSRHRDRRFREFHLDVIERIERELPARSLLRVPLVGFEGVVRMQGVPQRLRPRPAA